MTFEKIDNAAACGLKVAFGNELRRASFSGNSFGELRNLVSQLFTLEGDQVVLKYVDDEEDKVTMSTDNEVIEAVRLARASSKPLRVIVEVQKAPAPAPAPELPPQPTPQVKAEPADTAAEASRPHFYPGWGGRGFGHGAHGFRGRGGWGRHFPHPHPHPHPFGPGANGSFSPVGPCAADSAATQGFSHADFHGGFPHPHPPHHGFGPEFRSRHHPHFDPRGFGHHGGPGFHHAHMFGHGTFSPADESAKDVRNDNECGVDVAVLKAQRESFKEHKKLMKKHIEEMKANCTTKEDKEALREMKKKLKEEMAATKAAWHELKQAQKDKKEKQDKCKDKCKDKKDKKDKKEKRDKKDKSRLMARHVADVTIPDGAELPADTPVVKTWKMRNVGALEWPAGTQLLFISHKGDNLNGPEKVLIDGPVLPQQEVDVSVPLFTPSEPGQYTGFYRLATADGVKFGQRVWVSFVVTPHAAVSPSAPSSTANVDMVE